MFHKAIKLEYGEGTTLELTFQDGKVKRYNLSVLFEKYPQLEALKDRELFLSGKLLGAYGIAWNDDLDIEAETIYEDGETIREEKPAAFVLVGNVVAAARARNGISQKELSERSGIDQSDISKIERGIANPSVNTLNRIAQALDAKLQISMT
ncbi:MAG: helix-turn-helix domain-containing protein [Oscillospiraceae bacterium]|nr:helix-turn-helix domain-containing protein [Oscillospiraceae bacterium]